MTPEPGTVRLALGHFQALVSVPTMCCTFAGQHTHPDDCRSTASLSPLFDIRPLASLNGQNLPDPSPASMQVLCHVPLVPNTLYTKVKLEQSKQLTQPLSIPDRAIVSAMLHSRSHTHGPMCINLLHQLESSHTWKLVCLAIGHISQTYTASSCAIHAY